MSKQPLQILLVDDDEDSYVVTSHLLSMIKDWRCEVDWASTYEQGLAEIRRQSHDIYLIDYRLDAHDGLELLQEVIARGNHAPVIMLTGLKDRDVDVQAMEAGAADYLVKDRLDAPTLERAIRYARERQRLREALEERARRLRLLAGQLSEVEQRERSRVARLLHDHFQQLLVSVKMHIESLSADNLPQQQRDVQKLLDQVLEASRTLTTELTPPILLDAGLAAALSWLGRWMEDKYNLQVVTDIDAEAEPKAMCVRQMLFHATRELLFNASKHAQVDEACLTMARVGDQVHVTVTDKGVGFDPGMAMGRNGFGLVHLRERIQLVDGSMEVTSLPGEGCRITLIAPLSPFKTTGEVDSGTVEVEPPRRSTVRPDGEQKPRTRPIRVIVADDHPLVREGLVRMLNDHDDIEVVAEAGDGRQTMELTRELKPDIVLMDVVMPEFNGIDATRWIAAKLPEVRVVGLSMYDDEEMANAMRQAGAATYMSKGGPVETLLAQIREIAA